MRVCYGLVGMTRGHAARALAIGQELIDRGHEVLFCTEGDAEELLSARFGKDRVLKTSTPKYHLKNGRLSIWRTVFGNRKYLYGRRKLAKNDHKYFHNFPVILGLSLKIIKIPQHSWFMDK